MKTNKAIALILTGILMTGATSAAVPGSIVKAGVTQSASKKTTKYQTKKSIYVKKKVGNTYKYYTYKGKKIKLAKGKTVKLLKKVTIKKAPWGYVNFTYDKKNFKGYIPMSALKEVNKAVSEKPANPSESMNFFAYKLFAQMENEGNTCFSPYSIHMAFSMLDNGAEGDAKKDIEKVLGISDLDQWNQSMRELKTKLANRESKLLTANKMWLNENIVLNPDIQKEFKDPIKTYYDADVDMVKDFGQVTKNEINQWVENKTERQIQNIADALDENDAFALVNAVYFSGAWKEKFDVFDTKEEVFTNKDGSSSKVQMMNMREEHFKYAQNEKVAMLQLPYGEKEETVMDIILPLDNKKTLKETYGTMTYQEREALFDKADASSAKEFRRIGIPKFELATDTMKLKKALEATGMNSVFKIDTKDYFKIGAVFIKEVFHKAKITVDEGGTTAAAATLIQGATAALPAEDIFVADSPFIFVIRDTETDTILFMGEINHLSEKESAASEMKVLDEAKAEVISEPENIREEDDAQIIRTYEELQKLIQTIEETASNKKNTIAKLRSYTEDYFKDHILLFGGKETNCAGLEAGDIIVVNRKKCFITIKVNNELPVGETELFKMKYYGFTVELPKNETTDEIEKVAFR